MCTFWNTWNLGTFGEVRKPLEYHQILWNLLKCSQDLSDILGIKKSRVSSLSGVLSTSKKNWRFFALLRITNISFLGNQAYPMLVIIMHFAVLPICLRISQMLTFPTIFAMSVSQITQIIHFADLALAMVKLCDCSEKGWIEGWNGSHLDVYVHGSTTDLIYHTISESRTPPDLISPRKTKAESLFAH